MFIRLRGQKQEMESPLNNELKFMLSPQKINAQYLTEVLNHSPLIINMNKYTDMHNMCHMFCDKC